MPGVIDTNILLYAVNSDAEEHAAAAAFVARAGGSAEQWFVTEGILYEFLRVATHPRVFPRPLAWRDAVAVVDSLLSSPRVLVLGATEDHWALLPEVLRGLTRPSGNLFFDIRTVVLMREHGVRRIYTTDTDFLQFSGIEAVNPLHS
jgi:toxin-antitoxin system PIN domain toxin